jgi:glycerol-3-phosphate acyltransferase PlsY
VSDSIVGVGALAAAYVVGGVPFGLIVARWVAGIDVREHGSGNIGATNVYRVLGWRTGLIVWTLDVGKGILPPLACARLGQGLWWQIGAGLAAVAGHSFSPFLRFKGGKGAATSFGVMLGVMWPVGVGAFLIWSAVLGLTGYVSLGTIVASAALTPLSLILYPGDTGRLAFAVIAGALTILRHRSNIGRLLSGSENRFRRTASVSGCEESGPSEGEG